MADSSKTQMALRLPTHLVAQVDQRAEALGISRNQWYENMTDWVLSNTYTTPEALERAAMKGKP